MGSSQGDKLQLNRALLIACAKKDIADVRRLLAAGADSNYVEVSPKDVAKDIQIPFKYYPTPLTTTLQFDLNTNEKSKHLLVNSRLAVLDLLLRNGADPNQVVGSNMRPAVGCLWRGVKFISKLVKYGGDLDKASSIRCCFELSTLRLQKEPDLVKKFRMRNLQLALSSDINSVAECWAGLQPLITDGKIDKEVVTAFRKHMTKKLTDSNIKNRSLETDIDFS